MVSSWGKVCLLFRRSLILQLGLDFFFFDERAVEMETNVQTGYSGTLAPYGGQMHTLALRDK